MSEKNNRGYIFARQRAKNNPTFWKGTDYLAMLKRQARLHGEPPVGEKLIQAVTDDLKNGIAGGLHTGNLYYLDGNEPDPKAFDLYAVVESGPFTSRFVPRDGLTGTVDPRLAFESIREPIRRLEAEGASPLGVSVWIDGSGIVLEVVNLVEGKQAASDLAFRRGQDTIWSVYKRFTEDISDYTCGKGFAEFMQRRHDRTF